MRATFFKLKYLMVLLAFGLIAPGMSFAKGESARETEISLVDGIAIDKKENIFISKRDHNTIDKVDKNGILTRFAGTGAAGYSGDGGPATQATLKTPAGLLTDDKGNVYIADRENHVVRMVNPKGIITTIAGNGTAGFSGDGGQAKKASFNLPSGLALDSKGNLYISDRSNNRIRMVTPKGIVHTYAGNGEEGYGGDSGPALKARIDRPFGLAIDKKDNLYIADRRNNRIRKVNPSGIITTVAGDGGFFFMGDNGPSYRASIAGPTGVAVDDKGNLYIADRNNNRIRMVNKQGMIRTIAGTGQQDYNGETELARDTNLHLPFGLTLDKKGRLLIIDRSHYRIRRVDPAKGNIKTLAGNGRKKFAGDGGPATGATLNFPHGIVVDKKGNIIFSDKGHFRIRKISPEGIIQTIAGNGERGNVGNGVPALKASLFSVQSMILNDKEEVYFVSPSGFINMIRYLDEKENIHTFIETADKEYLASLGADKSQGLSMKSEIAMVTQFSDIVFDKDNNLFAADRINHQIRKIDPKGNVTTIAGTGESDFSGDGGPAIKANFRDPRALAMDKAGNLYIGDTANNRIRKIDTKGIITTIAGNGDHKDTGDGGPAIEAGIRSMDAIAISPDGELHIVGFNTHRIRKITKDGTIVTVAGKGYQGYFGDGGPATKAMLKQPAAVAFDAKGNMYISDMGNNRIRKVDSKGIISTFAGNGAFGWAHDGETVEIYLQNFP
jgi:sugar lactone lactonase YvrE